jgi:hypothetical protein
MWYRNAAQGENRLSDWLRTFAPLKLGYMYSEGEGVPRDDAEAVRWYRRAAYQGSADGKYNLGVMYEQGRGVAQNHVEAYMWFDIALLYSKEKKYTDARESVAQKMTSEQIAEAHRRAREWKPLKQASDMPEAVAVPAAEPAAEVAEIRMVEVQLLDWHSVLIPCPACQCYPCDDSCHVNGHTEMWVPIPGDVVTVGI